MATLEEEKRLHAEAIRQIDEDRAELKPATEELAQKRRRIETELGQRCAHVPILLAQLGQKARHLDMECPLVEELLPKSMVPERSARDKRILL